MRRTTDSDVRNFILRKMKTVFISFGAQLGIRVGRNNDLAIFTGRERPIDNHANTGRFSDTDAR